MVLPFAIFIVLSSLLFAEVNPENGNLPKDFALLPCTRSNSECMDSVLLAEHGRRIMHKGVSYSDFTSELDSGDNSDYLEEALEQAKVALKNGPPISDSINVSIMSSGMLDESITRVNHSLVSLTDSFVDYRKMLLLVFKQLLVGYKIESAILQEYYNKSISEEIMNAEK